MINPSTRPITNSTSGQEVLGVGHRPLTLEQAAPYPEAVVPPSSRTPVDIDQTDRGRALAEALLGNADLPTRRRINGDGHAPVVRSAGVALLERPPRHPPIGGLVPAIHLPRLEAVDPTYGIDDLRNRQEPVSRGRAAAIEWAVVAVVALIVAVLIKTFIFQTFEIPSESMEHTLEIGDRVVVNKLAYSIGGGVERGDVIVFDRPAAARTGDPNQPAELIKRVIGVPGDTVEARQGLIYVNGKAVKESGYLQPKMLSHDFPTPISVPPGTVFVMGDNRTHSYDSRFFGPIPTSTIVGRAVLIVWPYSRMTSL